MGIGPQAGQLFEPLRPSWNRRNPVFMNNAQDVVFSKHMFVTAAAAVLTRP